MYLFRGVLNAKYFSHGTFRRKYVKYINEWMERGSEDKTSKIKLIGIQFICCVVLCWMFAMHQVENCIFMYISFMIYTNIYIIMFIAHTNVHSYSTSSFEKKNKKYI